MELGQNFRIMRQRSRWKFLWFLVLIFQLAAALTIDDDVIRSRNGRKSLFSPRMDYNQWKPLGRGDPLKNDPTFDYVPPILDHVHYWMDPEPRPQAQANPGGLKTEILLLGVSSKKPATNSGYGLNHPSITASDRRDTIYEAHPKYHQDKSTHFYNSHHPNQRISRPNYFPSMPSQVIPSLMSLANQVLDRTVFSKTQESRIPYTVLVPPPMVTNDHHEYNNNLYSKSLPTSPITQEPISFDPFTPSQPLAMNNQYFSTPPPPKAQSGVTVQESNLIYQSSSVDNQKEFESVPSISWELPLTTEPARNSFMFNQNLSPPKYLNRIQFSPQNYTNKILEASDSNHNINYVTPPPLDDIQLTFKGQVSDDNDISDSYVKIEKPLAQMDHMGVEINNNHPLPFIFPHAEPFRAPQIYPPVSMQTIRDMESMKPPPVTQNPVYTKPVTNPVVRILKKEHVIPDLESANYIGSSSSISNTFVTTPKPEPSSSMATLATTTSEINTIVSDLPEITTISAPSATKAITTTETVTTMQTLTTDSLFKHYKQPMEPMKGPLYLIIQGHSKVKTYKPAKQIDGIMVQETNEIPYLKDKNIDYSIKHLHGYEIKEDFLKKAENIANQRRARTGNLQTLKHVVQTGLGAIDFSKGEAEMQSRSDLDLEETELEVGYEVVDSNDVTSEIYHKGIVEEARELS